MEPQSSPGASRLFTGIYCIIIVVLSIVICSTYHITHDISQNAVDAYYIFLYIVGTIWLLAFKPLSISCQGGNRRFHRVKSQHTSNKWLKGILVVFGIAIVIQDVFEFLIIFQYDDQRCTVILNYVTPLLQAVFVVCEINFLFRHSKIHLQDNRQISRFGTMHVLGANLSMWMYIIIYESMEYTQQPDNHDSELEEQLSTFPPPLFNTTGDMTEFHGGPEHDVVCECTSKFCDSVHQAEVFLYPFLIEFSLVASCMMYIVWKNVDTMPKTDTTHPKPVYKFYKSYIGFIFGGVVLVATIIVLVIVKNTIDHSVLKTNYFSEQLTLKVCNSFMVILETGMLIACVAGLILFKMDPRTVTTEVSLDVVLIMVTLTCVTALDIFYAFSVYISIAKEHVFIWGAVYPLVDLTQCVVQTTLLLWGLSRKSSYVAHLSSFTPATSSATISFSSKTASTTVIEESRTSSNSTSSVHNGDSRTDSTSVQCINESDIGYVKSTDDVLELPIQYDDQEFGGYLEIEDIEPSRLPKSVSSFDLGDPVKASKVKIDRKLSIRTNIVANGDLTNKRISIRNVMMFLLISNACIWIFWSLENTTFEIYTYPYYYYTQPAPDATNIWHSTTMFCLPLSIFFRMHSCACLFDVWSQT